jgi:hypothetical protein
MVTYLALSPGGASVDRPVGTATGTPRSARPRGPRSNGPLHYVLGRARPPGSAGRRVPPHGRANVRAELVIDSPHFTRAGRAVPAGRGEHLHQRRNGLVSDAVERGGAPLDEQALAALVPNAAIINLWNRTNVPRPRRRNCVAGVRNGVSLPGEPRFCLWDAPRADRGDNRATRIVRRASDFQRDGVGAQARNAARGMVFRAGSFSIFLDLDRILKHCNPIAFHMRRHGAIRSLSCQSAGLSWRRSSPSSIPKRAPNGMRLASCPRCISAGGGGRG